MATAVSPPDLYGAEPVRCVLYAATNVRSPLDIALQLQCCRDWIGASRLIEVAAFSDDGGRGTALSRRQGFAAAVRAVCRGVPAVVLASPLDLATTEANAHRAIERLTSSGAVVLSAKMQSGYAALDAIGSLEGLLEALKLGRSAHAVSPSVTPLAALLNAHVAETTRRERERLRKLRRPTAEARR